MPKATDIQARIVQKSKLLVQANLLEKMDRSAEAKMLFAQVAQMEEGIATALRVDGNDDWPINAVSAASAWAKAGDVSRARENFILVLSERSDVNLNQEIRWFLSEVGRMIDPTPPSPFPVWWSTDSRHKAPPRIHFLSVGIDDYSDAQIPRLRFAEDDAKAVLHELRTVFRLSQPSTEWLTVGKEATKNEIWNRLSVIERDAGPEDFVLFYFSGHGATGDDGNGYLLPSDANINALKRTGIGTHDLMKKLNAIRARQKLVLFDSCFTGRSTTDRLDFFRSKESGYTLEAWRPLPRSGISILAACEANQTALESSSVGHGLFTYFLLQWIRNSIWARDAHLTLNKLANYLRSNVAEMAQAEFKMVQNPLLESGLVDAFLPAFFGSSFEFDRQEIRIREAWQWLHNLLNRSGNTEADLQNFLSRYPFLLAEEAATILVDPILRGDSASVLAPDLILRNADGNEYLLVEIKSGTERLSRDRLKRFRAQMKEYANFFLDRANRSAFKQRYGFDIGQPRLVLILPRSPRSLTGLGGIEIVTYQDLLRRLKSRWSR